MYTSLLMAVANYYELDEYGVKRICFKGGSREALRDWRVLFPRSFEVWTGTGRKMKRLRGEQATGAGLPQQQLGLKVPMASMFECSLTAGTQVFYSWHSRARFNIIPISKEKTPASTAVNPAARLQREHQDRGWLAGRRVTHDCLGPALSPYEILDGWCLCLLSPRTLSIGTCWVNIIDASSAEERIQRSCLCWLVSGS